METRNRRHEQQWQLCTCHALSMSHSRSRTGQIPLTLLLTELSMGKLKTQTRAQNDNPQPSAQSLPTGLLKETQPRESKALRNLKRQHPDSFNVFWITELTLNPGTHENSSDAESLEAAHSPSQKTRRDLSASSTSTCSYACLGALHETSEWSELEGTFKGHLIQASCHEQGHLQLHQIFQIFFKCTERNHLPALFHLTWSWQHSDTHFPAILHLNSSGLHTAAPTEQLLLLLGYPAPPITLEST